MTSFLVLLAATAGCFWLARIAIRHDGRNDTPNQPAGVARPSAPRAGDLGNDLLAWTALDDHQFRRLASGPWS